jgi:hypothetical protein
MSIARTLQRLALVIALVAVAVVPASAQSQLDTSQARPFLGNWVIPVSSDMGSMTLQLNIVDQGGKVGATFGDPAMGVMSNITDITKQGEALHMNLMVDAQGQQIDVALQVSPDGDGINVNVNAMGGAFVATARGTRAAS